MPMLYIFARHNFYVILLLFAKIEWSKNRTASNILEKGKTYFLLIRHLFFSV